MNARRQPIPRPLLVGGVTAAAVLVLLVLVVSLGGSDSKPAPTTSTEAAISTLATSTTSAAPSGPVAPLTGRRVDDVALIERPALAAKIDNFDVGRMTALPQAGLNRADVVFEEIVEANITRLVAVFHSQQPGRIGPIRSARTTDVHLLPQLGPVLFAWSGGNDGVVGAVRGSPFLVDVGHDAASSLYSREAGRRAPHNLFVDADELWKVRPETIAAPRPLFRFRSDGDGPADTAEPAAGVDLAWGGGQESAPVSWIWDAQTRQYLRLQRDRPHLDADGQQVRADNIVVMITDYGTSSADVRSPEARTVGEGELLVFTDGSLVRGRWTRLAEDQPAALHDSLGNQILLTPGVTWVELPRVSGATVRG